MFLETSGLKLSSASGSTIDTDLWICKPHLPQKLQSISFFLPHRTHLIHMLLLSSSTGVLIFEGTISRFTIFSTLDSKLSFLKLSKTFSASSSIDEPAESFILGDLCNGQSGLIVSFRDSEV